MSFHSPYFPSPVGFPFPRSGAPLPSPLSSSDDDALALDAGLLGGADLCEPLSSPSLSSPEEDDDELDPEAPSPSESFADA